MRRENRILLSLLLLFGGLLNALSWFVRLHHYHFGLALLGMAVVVRFGFCGRYEDDAPYLAFYILLVMGMVALALDIKDLLWST